MTRLNDDVTLTPDEIEALTEEEVMTIGTTVAFAVRLPRHPQLRHR